MKLQNAPIASCAWLNDCISQKQSLATVSSWPARTLATPQVTTGPKIHGHRSTGYPVSRFTLAAVVVTGPALCRFSFADLEGDGENKAAAEFQGDDNPAAGAQYPFRVKQHQMIPPAQKANSRWVKVRFAARVPCPPCRP